MFTHIITTIDGGVIGLLVLADGTAEADAERAVKVASKAAEAAVSKAVQAAAAAGLEYRPPPDMQLDTPRVPKVRSFYTEGSGGSIQGIVHLNTCWFFLELPCSMLVSITTVVCNPYMSAVLTNM